MTFAFPAGTAHPPASPLRGDDPLTGQVFHVAGLVVDIAAGQDLSQHLHDIDQAALPHVPSWRGPDKAFNQQDATQARLASDLLAGEIARFRQQTLRHRLDVNLVNDLQFALAVTADRYLTCKEWPGQRLWQGAPLEARLFDTALGLAELERRLTALQPQTRLDDRRLHQACRFLLAVLTDQIADPAAQPEITEPAGRVSTGGFRRYDLVPSADGDRPQPRALMSYICLSAISAIVVTIIAIGLCWAAIRLWSTAQLAALWGG